MQSRQLQNNEILWSINKNALCLKFASRDIRGDFAHKIGCDFALHPDRLKGFVEYSRRINNETLYFQIDPQDNSIVFIDSAMREKFTKLLGIEDLTQSCRETNKLFLISDLLKSATPDSPKILNYDNKRLNVFKNEKSIRLLEDIFPSANLNDNNVESGLKPLQFGLKS